MTMDETWGRKSKNEDIFEVGKDVYSSQVRALN